MLDCSFRLELVSGKEFLFTPSSDATKDDAMAAWHAALEFGIRPHVQYNQTEFDISRMT